MDKLKLTIFLVLIMSFVGLYKGKNCEETLCAASVSQCVIDKFCDKSPADCAKCLGLPKYIICCVCMELCPFYLKYSNMEYRLELFQEDTTYPLLFHNITKDSSTAEADWQIMTYYNFKNRPGSMLLQENDVLEDNASNCKLAYHIYCLTRNKCKKKCWTMGASGYRWYHRNSCCECFGKSCTKDGLPDYKAICVCDDHDQDKLSDDEYDEYDDHDYGNEEKDGDYYDKPHLTYRKQL